MAKSNRRSGDERLARERGQEIRHARKALGLSQAELAQWANTSQQTVDRIERGAVEHSRAYGIIRSALGIVAPNDDSKLLFDKMEENERATRNTGLSNISRNVLGINRANMLPVVAENSGRNIDAIPRLYMVEFVKNAFAILISSSEMEPIFRPGDLAIVNPNLPATAGGEVVVRTDAGVLTVRTLVEENGGNWVLKVWNPPKSYPISMAGHSVAVIVAKVSKSR